MYTEHYTQTACVRWFRMQYPEYAPLLFNVPNGARRTQWEVTQAKQEGLVAGVVDLILLVGRKGYHSLCLEFKAYREEWKKGKRQVYKGRQSDEQKAWQKCAEDEGNKYVVIYTFEDFEKAVNEYLK